MVNRESPAYYLISKHSFAMSSIAGELENILERALIWADGDAI